MPRVISPPVCVALDKPNLDAARRLLDALAGSGVGVFKVGLELFASEGPAAVEEVLNRGADVFLDLKVNDIPKQAAGAVWAAGRIGVTYLTVHANGGRAMVGAAVDAAAGGGPQILVVSVTTSLDDEQLREVGVERGVAAQVDAMAALATREHASGLVLGTGDLRRVRAAHPDLLLVTPGIRPASGESGGSVSADGDDQRRTGTPGEAIASGADMLVVGRAVGEAPDPAAALEGILEEIAQARAGAVT